MPEPLFVFAVYDDLVQCAGIANTNDRLTALWKIVNAVPKVHFENLRYLIKFFARLAANSEVNKMTPQNIAIAIAPSLIWQPPAGSADGNSSPNSTANPMTYGLDMCSANQYGIIIETLILYSDWFFPGEIKFDSLKTKRKRSSSAETSARSQQNSPKSVNKSPFGTTSRTSSAAERTPAMERNPIERNQPSITPRMSTRSKKQPAPIPPISKALNQSNGNQTGFNLSNQNLNYAESMTSSSNFVTNSPFLNSNSNSNNSYSFHSEPKPAGQSPTLKSFERKGSLESQPFAKHTPKKHGSNSSSGTGSTSDSQDSVNSFNSNPVHDGAPPKFDDPNNRSNDSLLSSAEAYPQPFKLSSSSSENLLDDIPQPNASTPRTDAKKAMMANQPTGGNLIGGSLDRRQLSQLRNERSRQINQHKTSASFMAPSRPRNRPNSIPPEPPSKPFGATGKPRSHDDLLMDQPNAMRFSSLKRDEESADDKDEEEKKDENKDEDKKYNLKLDVKGADYEEGVPGASGNSTCLVSYVKLDGSEVKFNSATNAESNEKPPEKPPRTSPPLEKPPRPQAPTIFKSSKSLMNEHTYL